MNPQLEILLQLQDLKAQRRELARGETERELQEEQFNIDIEEALRHLDIKIGEIEGELEPEIRSRYERIRQGRQRVVVPVIAGVCYGCFISIPTAVSSDALRNDVITNCENCGRFVYVAGSD